jgi:hypothetical protein
MKMKNLFVFSYFSITIHCIVGLKLYDCVHDEKIYISSETTKEISVGCKTDERLSTCKLFFQSYQTALCSYRYRYSYSYKALGWDKVSCRPRIEMISESGNNYECEISITKVTSKGWSFTCHTLTGHRSVNWIHYRTDHFYLL